MAELWKCEGCGAWLQREPMRASLVDDAGNETPLASYTVLHPEPFCAQWANPQTRSLCLPPAHTIGEKWKA